MFSEETLPTFDSISLSPCGSLQWQRHLAADPEAALDLLAAVPVAGRDQRRQRLHLQQQPPVLLQHRQLDLAVPHLHPEGPHPQQPRPQGVQ